MLALCLTLAIVLSSLPLPVNQQGRSNDVELATAITAMQFLADNGKDTTFTPIFSDLVASLQLAAGIKTVVVTHTDTEDGKTVAVVCVRLPYLLPPSLSLQLPAPPKAAPIRSADFIDTSIILSPETPPPIA